MRKQESFLVDLKLHVYAQSIFLDYDIHIVEDRVGKERAESSYSWKTLMKKGVSVSNGTDCPVEWPNALAGMQCAITRQTLWFLLKIRLRQNITGSKTSRYVRPIWVEIKYMRQ